MNENTNENIVNFEDIVMPEEFTATIENEEALVPLMQMIEVIMSFDDEKLAGPALEIYAGMLRGIFTPDLRAQLIEEIIFTLKKQEVPYEVAKTRKANIIDSLNGLVGELKPSAPKRTLLLTYVDEVERIYDEALEKFGGVAIVLPMKLDEGAQVPTYAHETDAAADLYAAEDVTLPAHSLSNLIRTGVHIALPTNWVAHIVPRSSIGMKTGLRLSNSIGVIDEEYRGNVGIIYDNISDSDYTIHKGDRIAQMYLIPAYRFKPEVVEELSTTDRGEGGYGSTGK